MQNNAMISYPVKFFHFRMKFEILCSFLFSIFFFSRESDDSTSCVSFFVFYITLDCPQLRCSWTDKLLYLSALIKNRILSILRMVIIFLLYFLSSRLKYRTEFSLSVISTWYHYIFYDLAICYANFFLTSFTLQLIYR